jgi:hypothetical protein
MVIEPQPFAPSDSEQCINCGKPYDARIGGILWHGHKDAPGFKETFICSSCAPTVIPAFALDLVNLGVSRCSQRSLKHLIEAGKAASQYYVGE